MDFMTRVRSVWVFFFTPLDAQSAWALRYAAWLAAGLVLLEVGLTEVILRMVPYTEIDWVAYMQEVAGVLGGERDYLKLRGDTGPLV